MFTGVLLGLAAALCQSASYLCLRVFSWKFGRGSLDLLAYSHVIMGLFALALLPLVWPGTWPPVRAFVFPLVGGVVFYFVGQVGLMRALRHADASWVSPLLGLKIILLAVIAMAFLGQHLAGLQWAAAGATVLATFTLGQSRGRFSGRALGWVLTACGGYSLSDLCIKALADPFVAELGLFQGCLISASLSYILAGLAGTGLALARPRAPFRVWLGAAPFAVAWFTAMLFLFACFAAIGVVYGNIVQSTRGVLSVALGSAVAAAGFVHLEERVSRGLLIRRLTAALLMALAIALFHLGRTQP
jgi:drug/metabolite transporter (DMT)-like permease